MHRLRRLFVLASFLISLNSCGSNQLGSNHSSEIKTNTILQARVDSSHMIYADCSGKSIYFAMPVGKATKILKSDDENAKSECKDLLEKAKRNFLKVCGAEEKRVKSLCEEEMSGKLSFTRDCQGSYEHIYQNWCQFGNNYVFI